MLIETCFRSGETALDVSRNRRRAVGRSRVGHMSHHWSGLSGAAILLPTAVRSLEDVAVAAGEDVVTRAGDGLGRCERSHPRGGGISRDVSVAGVKVIPARAVMIVAGHARRESRAAIADAKGAARSGIYKVAANLMRVDEPGGSPPAVPAPMLSGVIAPPAVVKRMGEPTGPAPVQAGVEPPSAGERIVIRRVAPGA